MAMIAFATIANAKTNTSTYTVNVQDFYELNVSDGINVIYRCNPDSAGIAIFSTTPQLTSRIMFSNPKGKLKIELSDEERNADTLRGLPTVTVYSSFLSKAENRSDSALIVDNPAAGPTLKLKLTGNGRLIARNVHVTTLDASIASGKGEIFVYGKCKDANLNFNLTGNGKITADRLVATNVKCKLFGNGEVSCNVNGGDLTLQGISGATIYYRGKPTNIKNRATKAKLVNLDELDAAKPQN